MAWLTTSKHDHGISQLYTRKHLERALEKRQNTQNMAQKDELESIEKE